MRGTDSLQDRLAAQDYFDKHDIRRLLRELTEELYIRRPSDPVRFLAEKLAARAGKKKHATAGNPIARPGAADEVAAAVVFALENAYMTGAVLEIDGGLVVAPPK